MSQQFFFSSICHSGSEMEGAMGEVYTTPLLPICTHINKIPLSRTKHAKVMDQCVLVYTLTLCTHILKRILPAKTYSHSYVQSVYD